MCRFQRWFSLQLGVWHGRETNQTTTTEMEREMWLLNQAADRAAAAHKITAAIHRGAASSGTMLCLRRR